MNISIPENPAESLSRQDLDTFLAMTRQGRPLILEGRTIRVASFFEWLGCRNDTAAITTLFQKAMTSQWNQAPAKNRSNLTMQAAGLWRKKVSKGQREEYTRAFRYMQLGIKLDRLGVSHQEADAFVKWICSTTMHHYMTLQNIQVKAEDGKIQIPIKQGDEVKWLNWDKASTLTGKDELFEPHPGNKTDSKIQLLKACRVGEDGFQQGHSWSVEPHQEVPNPASLFAYDRKEADGIYALGLDVWSTLSASNADNHTAAHLEDGTSGQQVSFGIYRFDSWEFYKACKLDQGYVQVPDCSHTWWNTPTYLRPYRFACSKEEHAEFLERGNKILNSQNIPYQAPTLLCQQMWSHLLDRKLDLSRNLWKHIAFMIKDNGGSRILSYTPSPLRKAGTWMIKGIARSVEQWTPESVKHVAAAVSIPFENIVAWVLGGTRVSERMQDQDEHPALLQSWKCFFTERRRMTHPTVAIEILNGICEAYSQQVEAGTEKPPHATPEAWLAKAPHERYYPIKLLAKIPTRTHK